MTCPYCNHTFPLTWRRYFKENGRRHVCPRCFKTSRTEFRLLTFVIVLIVYSTCTLPGVILLKRSLGPGWWCLLPLVPALFVIFPLGKMFENRKELKPIDGEAPSDTAFCAECSGVFQVQDMIAHNVLHVCARCKPIFLQKLAEGAKMGSTPATELGRTRLVPLWFWLLLGIVALAAIIMALLFPITGHSPL